MADLSLPPVRSVSLLVVEDHVLIALDLENMLLDLGATQVSVAYSVDQALQLIATTAFDGALLDVRLGGAASLPVAIALRDAGIPFAFATGYNAAGMIPEEFRTQPVIPKPFQQQTLLQVLGMWGCLADGTSHQSRKPAGVSSSL